MNIQKYLISVYLSKQSRKLQDIPGNQSNLFQFRAMMSNPCQSAVRSSRCPTLSESESEDDKTIDSNSGAATDASKCSSTADSQNSAFDSTQDSKPTPSSTSKHLEKQLCFHIERPSTTRADSIFKLESNIGALQQQINDFKLEKERVLSEIREKKQQLINAIMEIIEFEKVIQGVEAVMSDKLHNFQSRLFDLETKRKENFMNVGDEQLQNFLENEIDDVKQKHQEQVKADEIQRNIMTQQAQFFAASLGDIVQEYQTYFDELTEEKSVEDFNENLSQLKRLINRPPQFCKDSAGNRFYINVAKETIYQVEAYSSEYKLNTEGNREKVKEGLELHNDDNGEFFLDLTGRKIYTKFFFEDEFGRFYVDIHGNRNYKTDPEASEYKLVNGNWVKIKDGTYETDERGLRVRSEPKVEIVIDEQDLEGGPSKGSFKRSEIKLDDDMKYIKATVGVAIRKGLAAVVLHQPDDPVNYFANFLLDYRYKQRLLEQRDKDLKFFQEQREKFKASNELQDL